MYAIGVERTAFRVRIESVPVLAPGARPITVLHLSDSHLAPWQHAKRAWMRHLTDLEPDLVVSTGDMLGHADALPALAETLEPFRGVPGVFVHGASDYFSPIWKNPLLYFGGPSSRRRKHVERRPDLDTAELERVYADLGWLDLDNRVHALELRGSRLELFGVNDPHHGWDRLDALPREVLRMREHTGWTDASAGDPVAIGVAHAPYRRVLDAFVGLGAEAIFAGHTHGGQVRIPGGPALVTNCDVPREQASGLSTWTHGDRSAWLNVSQGIGTSIFAPFRLGTPPEAVVVTLVARD